MNRTRTALAALPLAAAVLAGCGGQPSSPPYRQDAARACRALAGAVRLNNETGQTTW